jgi:exonuclease SbcD
VRALCTGDWHIGAGMDYAADRLADQRQTIEKIVDLAIDHDVDAVLLAGDLWHRPRPTPTELLTVWEPLHRLHGELDCDIVAINGNHCVEAADGPVALDLFADFVDVYRQPGIWQGPGAAVACLPWSPVSRLVAARGSGDRDDLHLEAAELLLATARGLRAQIPAGQPAVLMGHWSVSGARTPTGVLTDTFREVVLELADLEAIGFDAVVLGHIHLPEVINGPFDGGNPALYVGSPAPVDFGESDSPHGCWLLEVGEGETRTTFLPVSSRPFVTIDADGIAITGPSPEMGLFSDEDEVADAVVRVRYTATEEQARHIDQGLIRRQLYDAGAHRVFAIQPTILRADRARVAGVDEELAPLSALDLWLEAEALDGWERDSLRLLTSRYLEAVGA